MSILTTKTIEKQIFNLSEVKQGDMLECKYRYDINDPASEKPAMIVVNEVAEEAMSATIFPKNRSPYFISFVPGDFEGQSSSMEIVSIPVLTGKNLLDFLTPEEPTPVPPAIEQQA